MTSSTISIQGLTFERVTGLDVLVAGDWLCVRDGEDRIQYLTALRPEKHPQGRDGFRCTRLGRNIAPEGRQVLLTDPTYDLGTVWRATERRPSGIPGTWCDGYDGNGDNCGRSLLHAGPCRR